MEEEGTPKGWFTPHVRNPEKQREEECEAMEEEGTPKGWFKPPCPKS